MTVECPRNRRDVDATPHVAYPGAGLACTSNGRRGKERSGKGMRVVQEPVLERCVPEMRR
jgi:hypothetical protein